MKQLIITALVCCFALSATAQHSLQIDDGTNVTIINGSSSGGTYSIPDGGGTLLTTASPSALPNQAGHSGKFLTTDGSTPSWVVGGGSLTGTGSNGNVAFWTTGSNLSNSSNLRWDNTNGRLGVNTVPNVAVDVNGGLALQPGTTHNATTNPSTLTVGDRSYFRITADDTPGNRELDVTNGLRDGQMLVLECATDNNNGVQLNDADGNMGLAGNANLNNRDIILLIWNNSLSKWMEIYHRDNDGDE